VTRVRRSMTRRSRDAPSHADRVEHDQGRPERPVAGASRVPHLDGRARRPAQTRGNVQIKPPSRNADVSLRSSLLAGRRRRCGHRPDGVPRVRRHHQARWRQRRARLLRKCPLPPLAFPSHARSPEADRRGIEIRVPLRKSPPRHVSFRATASLRASRVVFGFQRAFFPSPSRSFFFR
jgi:hypothetical protein